MGTETGMEGGDQRRAPGRPAHDVFAARLAAARARQQNPVAGMPAAGGAVAAPAGPDVELVHPEPGTRPRSRSAARHRRPTATPRQAAPRTHRTHRHRAAAHAAVISTRGLVLVLTLVGLALAVAWVALVL
jgi:hypothetical protein